MKTPPRLLAALLAALASLCATETKYWSQAGHADFDKGKLKGLSLSSDGRLTLAPASRELFDSASVYLWTLAEDSKGNLYAGGGGPGGPGAYLYVIPPHGKGRQIAQIDDLEVHAIAVDSKDRVYVATSPDGKVYRIGVKNKPEVFYDPKAKYIWGMAFNSNGDLFVATGDRGEVYRVTPDGKGSVFYKTSDTHARSLAIEPSFLLLDEPFSGIDPIQVLEIQRIIFDLKRANIGILVTDHNVRETLSVCDWAYILAEGKVLESGDPRQIATSERARRIYLGEQFTL